jgi:hypothetical protein
MIEFFEHLFGLCGENHININHILLYISSAYVSGYFLYILTNGKKKHSTKI